ncbi:MAG: hypothetical protein CSA66_01845 [Proteobacteria bacterium]|nr:MAG: hypothetical protein CSA66_01845 [Pseudomonadota bacterium]
MREQVKDLEHELAQLRQTLAATEAERDTLRWDLTSGRAANGEAAPPPLPGADNPLHAARTEAERLAAEVERLEASLTETEEARDDALARLDQATTARIAAEAERDAALDDAERATAELDQAHRAQGEELEALRQRHDELRTELEETAALRAEVTADLEASEARILELSAEAERLETERDQLEAEQGEELTRLTTELEALREELQEEQELRTAAEAATQSAHSAPDADQAPDPRTTGLQAERDRDAVFNEIARLERALRDSRANAAAAVDAARTRADRSAVERDELRGAIAKLEAELEAARVTIRYLERLGQDVDNLQAALGDAEDRAGLAEAKAQRLEQSLRDTRTDLAEVKARAAHAEANLAAAVANQGRLEAAVSEAEDRLAAAEADLEAAQADQARLDAALAEADRRAVALTADNANLERKLAAAVAAADTAPTGGDVPPPIPNTAPVVHRKVPPPRSAQRIRTLSVRSIKQLATFVSQTDQAKDKLQRYVHTFPSEVRALRGALSANDAVGVAHVAQRLHHQFKEIGVQKLADLAAHIELASSSAELIVAERLLDALETEFQAVRPWLTEA